MPGPMGTGHKDALGVPSEALWLPQLGGTTWAHQARLQPSCDPPRGAEAKRIGYPLSDVQILQILDQLPQGEKHSRWRFAIQLCAVYGLRPEELRYLHIKDGANGPELCTVY